MLNRFFLIYVLRNAALHRDVFLLQRNSCTFMYTFVYSRKYLFNLYSIMIYFLIYILLISLSTFIVFGVDKYKAKKKLRRLSEKNLLTLVAFGGGLWALAGMEVFRHKTIKGAFLWKFWLILFAWVILAILLVIYWS